MAERTSVHFSAIIIRMKLTKENRTHRKTKNILRHRHRPKYMKQKNLGVIMFTCIKQHLINI